MSDHVYLSTDAALRAFKERDDLLQGAAVIDSESMMSVCMAWEQGLVGWNPPGIVPVEIQEAGAEAIWQWLWGHVNLKGCELSSSSGLTLATAILTLKQLRERKLVYPDGTVSESAKKTMRIRVRQVLTKGAKAPKLEKQPKKPKQLEAKKEEILN